MPLPPLHKATLAIWWSNLGVMIQSSILCMMPKQDAQWWPLKDDCQTLFCLSIQCLLPFALVFENLKEKTLKKHQYAHILLTVSAGWWAWLIAQNPASVVIQSMARSSALHSQVHWFTMSTSLIHHVLHVGQTIHVDSFKPSSLTGKATAVGGLPNASLAMTHLPIIWKYHNMLLPKGT